MRDEIFKLEKVMRSKNMETGVNSNKIKEIEKQKKLIMTITNSADNSKLVNLRFDTTYMRTLHFLLYIRL